MRRSPWIRPVSLAVALLVAGPMTAGCYGKFALTKKVYDWNGSLGNKFVVSLVMFVLFLVPVYPIAGFVDWILLNVIEFWTGANPMTLQEGETQEKLVERADGTRVKMILSDRGETMRVETAAPGQEPKVLVLHRTAEGFAAADAAGASLGAVAVDAAGGVSLRDASGALVRRMSAGQVDQLEAAADRGMGRLLKAVVAQRDAASPRVAAAR
jgi:hypothetical protein